MTQSCSQHIRLFIFVPRSFGKEKNVVRKSHDISKHIRSKTTAFKGCMESLQQFILLGPREGRGQKSILALVSVCSIKGEIVGQAIYSIFIT